METLLVILVVMTVLLAFGMAYCLGYLKGFEEIQNDYGNRLADLFLDYIKRTET